MDALINILPSRLFEVLEKASINTPKQVILLSKWDIQRATKLLNDDIQLLKNLVSRYYSPVCVTCNDLDEEAKRIHTGCLVIDNMLRGGFRRGIITELYGESGSGKTQIAIQTAAYCDAQGCVIICTEDPFPINRFNQIYKNIKDISEVKNYKNNVFIEHVTESHDLLACIRVRLPKLLSRYQISSIIIDSVAAPYRCENTNYIQRAEELREFANILLSLAQDYNLAVICINQVTASFDGSDEVLPTLGLVWSNMISYRLKLAKLCESLKSLDGNQKYNVRELTVIYAPDLPSGISAKLLITNNGVQGIT